MANKESTSSVADPLGKWHCGSTSNPRQRQEGDRHSNLWRSQIQSPISHLSNDYRRPSADI
jgi:hypothetical protein